MKTLTELAEDCGADLDTVHPLSTKIIFHDEEDLQKLIDARNKQLSEPIIANMQKVIDEKNQAIEELCHTLDYMDGWLEVRHIGGLMPNEKSLLAKIKAMQDNHKQKLKEG